MLNLAQSYCPRSCSAKHHNILIHFSYWFLKSINGCMSFRCFILGKTLIVWIVFFFLFFQFPLRKIDQLPCSGLMCQGRIRSRELVYDLFPAHGVFKQNKESQGKILSQPTSAIICPQTTLSFPHKITSFHCSGPRVIQIMAFPSKYRSFCIAKMDLIELCGVLKWAYSI